MLLDDIIKIPAIESVNLECKARLNRDDTEGWLKTIAGFSNAEGGTFFIGVEDKSHKLLGFSRLSRGLREQQRVLETGRRHQHRPADRAFHAGR